MGDCIVFDRGLEKNIYYLILTLIRKGFRVSLKCGRRKNLNFIFTVVNVLYLRILYIVIFIYFVYILRCY